MLVLLLCFCYSLFLSIRKIPLKIINISFIIYILYQKFGLSSCYIETNSGPVLIKFFFYQLGARLSLTHKATATAFVFRHNYFLRQSFARNMHVVPMRLMLFLANDYDEAKTEHCCNCDGFLRQSKSNTKATLQQCQ